MIKINIKQLLESQNKTKYWFVQEMNSSYQTINKLIDNQTDSIHFDTLDKICNILNCEISDVLIRDK